MNLTYEKHDIFFYPRMTKEKREKRKGKKLLKTRTTMMITSFVLSLVLSSGCGSPVPVHINNLNGFTQFVSDVNTGKSNYSGTTVFLDSDITLSGETTEPIGNDLEHFFCGTFDGQGHVISNLIISTSAQFVGLFGYSAGLTIKNVVLDESCSITNTHNNRESSVGSIIGKCKGDFEISEVVNMASVNLIVREEHSFYLGGIAGVLSIEFRNSRVYNCVNYGSILCSGSKSTDSYIGGIVGNAIGKTINVDETININVTNNANYGTITYSSTGDNVYIGGIVGYSLYTNTENCLSGGMINKGDNIHIGSILGFNGAINTIKGCYWTEDVGTDNEHGNSDVKSDSIKIDTLNTTTVESLNIYATNYSFNKWIPLNLDGGRINNLSQEMLAVIGSHFPGPTKEGYSFLYWYVNSNSADKYDPQTTDIANVKSLTTKWGKNIEVTFISEETNYAETLQLVCEKEYGDLPRPNITGYTLSGWFTDKNGGTKIESNTIVLKELGDTFYAHWTVNNYTVTFNATGGDVTPNSKSITFNTSYGDLPIPIREGFTFIEWTDENNNESFTKESIVRIPNDHTLYAQWSVNKYTLTFIFLNGTIAKETLNFNDPIDYPTNVIKEDFSFVEWTPKPDFMPAKNLTVKAQWNYTGTGTNYVEINFGSKEMTETEINEIIKKYTDDLFTIEKINEFEDETFVIVKFTDVTSAENFIEKVSASSDADIAFKDVKFTGVPMVSLSAKTFVSIFFTFVLI